MLKLNTVLTALALILMAVLGMMLSTALSKLDSTHDAMVQFSAQMQSLRSQMDDHEIRIRQTEQQVTVLQNQRGVFNSPKAIP